jgi:hypothetical protein
VLTFVKAEQAERRPGEAASQRQGDARPRQGEPAPADHERGPHEPDCDAEPLPPGHRYQSERTAHAGGMLSIANT